MNSFVAGRVQTCIDHWHHINAPTVIVDWIRDGVPTAFDRTPTEFCLPNNAFKIRETQFLDSEIKQLLLSGALTPYDNPRCVSPVKCVPKKTTFRLVTDLRHLNDFCAKCSFQNDDIKFFTFSKTIAPNDHLVSVDIESGFFNIPVHRYFYRCIRWRGKTYAWTVLPFGLSLSSYYFCKILRPLVGHLQEKGIKLTV